MGTRNKKQYKKRHPDSSYDAKYPYLQAIVTESGHEFHWDNTPGNERIREAHMSGTYYEVSPDGKRVSQVVGDQIEYVKGGQTTTVDKNVDIKHGGSVRTSSHGDHHTEVKGNQTTAIDKDQSTTVGGDTNKAMKGDMALGIVGKSTTTIGKAIKVKGDAEMHTVVDGVSLHEYGAEVTTTAESDMTDKSKSRITQQVGGSSIVIESGSITLTVGGSKIIIEDGTITLDAALVKVTVGGQQVTPTSNLFQ